MRVGLGITFIALSSGKYPKKARRRVVPGKDEPEYARAHSIVRNQIPGSYKMMLAHECHYQKRKFVHLSLMDGSNMVSLVIADKTAGESFHTEDMLPP